MNFLPDISSKGNKNFIKYYNNNEDHDQIQSKKQSVSIQIQNQFKQEYQSSKERQFSLKKRKKISINENSLNLRAHVNYTIGKSKHSVRESDQKKNNNNNSNNFNHQTYTKNIFQHQKKTNLLNKKRLISSSSVSPTSLNKFSPPVENSINNQISNSRINYNISNIGNFGNLESIPSSYNQLAYNNPYFQNSPYLSYKSRKVFDKTGYGKIMGNPNIIIHQNKFNISDNNMISNQKAFQNKNNNEQKSILSININKKIYENYYNQEKISQNQKIQNKYKSKNKGLSCTSKHYRKISLNPLNNTNNIKIEKKEQKNKERQKEINHRQKQSRNQSSNSNNNKIKNNTLRNSQFLKKSSEKFSNFQKNNSQSHSFSNQKSFSSFHVKSIIEKYKSQQHQQQIKQKQKKYSKIEQTLQKQQQNAQQEQKHKQFKQQKNVERLEILNGNLNFNQQHKECQEQQQQKEEISLAQYEGMINNNDNQNQNQNQFVGDLNQIDRDNINIDKDIKEEKIKQLCSPISNGVSNFNNNNNNNHVFRKIPDKRDQYQKMRHNVYLQKQSYFDNYLTKGSLTNYTIKSHIGKGCFSIVSQAIDRDTKTSYAVKTYNKYTDLDWYRLQSIKKQIKNLSLLSQHENVVQLLHVVKDKQKILLVMQNAGKQSLAGILRKTPKMSQSLARFYFKQILQAVKYCHQKGVCHRDLKPQNILIDQTNTIKLIDFGFSTQSKSRLNNFCGTPPFMSPQITKKQPYIGQLSDVWALGVLLYIMTHGKFPFKANSQKQLYRIIQQGKYQLSDQISIEARQIFKGMLKVTPQDRFTVEKVLNCKWFIEK